MYINSFSLYLTGSHIYIHTNKHFYMKQTMASAKKAPTKFTNTPSILHPPYFHMICEAITSLKHRKGSSQPAIAKVMKDQYQNLLPPNCKKTLSVQLKKLVKSGKLTKIKNSYKISASDNVKVMAAAPVKKSQKKKDVLNATKPNSKSFKIKKSHKVSAYEEVKMVAGSSTRGSRYKSSVSEKATKKVEKSKRLSQKVKTSMALKKKREAKKGNKNAKKQG
ncbi:histone H1-like [Cornus florida]|uniref:histone H1-like n=1 Tax=Cornus florida TaxID=4283 RepID=UPI00289777BB|nr:histone H1-like [Cornus florida]